MEHQALVNAMIADSSFPMKTASISIWQTTLLLQSMAEDNDNASRFVNGDVFAERVASSLAGTTINARLFAEPLVQFNADAVMECTHLTIRASSSQLGRHQLDQLWRPSTTPTAATTSPRTVTMTTEMMRRSVMNNCRFGCASSTPKRRKTDHFN